jgi:hypothetical protein
MPAALVVLCGWLVAPTVAQPIGDPTDLPREHVETISSSSHEYVIDMGGTMDGPSTRDPIGYAAWDQVFEPNRFVRLENVGETPVVNPWLLVNGKHCWRTVADSVEEIMGELPPDASDGERARAVWEFERHHRFHATTGDAECLDPVKVFNVYGYTLCGDDAQVIADLWRTAGFKTRRGRPQGHCTTEVFYDGGWHLLDGDENIICLLRDNETIAQEADIVRDHDLMKRTHTYGILAGDSRNTDEFSASLCVYEGEDRMGDWQSHVGHTMDFTLRPGESIEWRWDHREKAHGIWEGQSLLTGWGATAWARHCNGYWRYEPKIVRHSFLDSLLSRENLATFTCRSPLLHPAEAGKPTNLAIQMKVPYVLVGGRVRLRGLRGSTEDRIALSLSYDGKEWTPVTEVGETGAFETTADLDPLLPMNGPPRYSYQLRVEMQAARSTDAVGLDGVLIENGLQMAVLSLPSLTLGTNRVTYTDESPGPRSVRVTHSWVERSSSRAPAAPSAALYPPDKGEAEGTTFAFEWKPATDPDGDAIADYHFQLSNRPDMRWPLSPNFDRLIARTPDKGTARYTLPCAGLLNPDQTYYWRVRARDGKGVWGEWSRTWSFTPRGPGMPLNLSLKREGNRCVLGWQSNPKGRRPAAFRVYGSDEKGFSVSDVPYKVNVGNQDNGRSPDFPANLVAETTGTTLTVIGADVTMPDANTAFYRVVAVDAKGNRSGPSDYVAAPRPLIYTSPVLPAQLGKAWEYRAATVRSIGDLRSRTIEGKGVYNAAFWNEEKPEWSLAEAPEWLAVEPDSGLVSSTPPAAGEFPVTLRVAIAGAGQTEQSFTLTVR